MRPIPDLGNSNKQTKAAEDAEDVEVSKVWFGAASDRWMYLMFLFQFSVPSASSARTISPVIPGLDPYAQRAKQAIYKH